MTHSTADAAAAPALATTAPKVTCEQVADIVKAGDKGDVVVVDVRGEEFKDGHVKGAIQWETSKFQDPSQVDALIDGPLKGKSQVIVHCMLSQQRGPLCASKLLERLQERGVVGPEVSVMAGGWDRFSSLYGTDAGLVEAGTDEPAK